MVVRATHVIGNEVNNGFSSTTSVLDGFRNRTQYKRNDFKWSLMDRVSYETVLKIRFQLLLSSQACLAVENRFVQSKYFLDSFLLNESKGSLVRINQKAPLLEYNLLLYYSTFIVYVYYWWLL